MESNPKRAYTMSDAELTQFVTNLCGYLTRDAADVAVFGITAAKITALQALQSAFATFLTDVQYSAMVMQANQAVAAQRTAMQQAVAFIRTRAARTFGRHSGYYDEFGFAGLAQTNTRVFLMQARLIAAAAEKYLAELTGAGQTQEEIDALKAKCDELLTLLNKKAAAESNRTEAARERIIKGNTMYMLAAEYCTTGRSFYADINPAKYLDYIIYDRPNAPRAKTTDEPTEAEETPAAQE